MAYFYGTVRGSRGMVSRTGGKKSRLVTHCASGQGSVHCCAYVNDKGVDCVQVSLEPWKGVGISKLLYDGPIGEYVPLEQDNLPDTKMLHTGRIPRPHNICDDCGIALHVCCHCNYGFVLAEASVGSKDKVLFLRNSYVCPDCGKYPFLQSKKGKAHNE